jgi:sulfur-oxidizing protein SoxZ
MIVWNEPLPCATNLGGNKSTLFALGSPFRIHMSTIKIKIKRLESVCLLRILITHPMETGRRKDKESGEIVAAHYILEVNIEHNGKVVASCQFGAAVSRDPYLSFRLKQAKLGDSIKVSWLDNLGQSDNQESQVP